MTKENEKGWAGVAYVLHRVRHKTLPQGVEIIEERIYRKIAPDHVFGPEVSEGKEMDLLREMAEGHDTLRTFPDGRVIGRVRGEKLTSRGSPA